MLTEKQIKENLEGVLVPAVKRSIVGLNMVREVTISDKKVKVILASTGLIPGAQDWIKNKAMEALKALPEVDEAEVIFTDAKPIELNKVEHIHCRNEWKGRSRQVTNSQSYCRVT